MFQYSLRSLLLATLAVAVATWVLFVIPGPVGVLLLGILLIMIPGMTVAGIVYFRGYGQAFCIGAAPVQLMLPMIVPGMFWGYPFRGGADSSLILKFYMLGFLVVLCMSGAAAAWVRLLAQRAEARREDERIISRGKSPSLSIQNKPLPPRADRASDVTLLDS